MLKVNSMAARDPKAASIYRLAKAGQFEEFVRAGADVDDFDLAKVFERAVTDFRTVKRNPGHQQILEWCLAQGLDLNARAGWLNQSMVCLAAMYGNNKIVEAMVQAGVPENPFARASVGDLEFLQAYATRHDFTRLTDENGFNLLFACAGSGLGRHDEERRRRLVDVCCFLLAQGVDPRHEVEFELPVFPAFLCASAGGNEDVMRLLLEHDGLVRERFHQTLEHALEPHQRSGEPFFAIAELILQHGFDVNDIQGQDRSLLHGAANRGTVKAVKWLLEHGADPNSLDAFGRTPLHVCAMRNTSTQVAKLLIEAGSAVNTNDSAGKTPFDYASENSRTNVAEYLKSVTVY